MNENTLKLARYLSLVVLVALSIGAFDHGVFCDNETNHTGGSPYVLFLLFAPVALVSVRMIKSEGRKWGIPLALALAGALNVVAFDALDVMKGYSAWIRAGMPERPAWSEFHRCSK